MNIATPYAKLLPVVGAGETHFTPAMGIALLRHVEWCARISHRSEDSEPDTLRFLESVVLRHGDWSITEHASVSVDFHVDRGVTHELVRHRLFAFTQESTRFVNYEKKTPPSFIAPFADKRSCEDLIWRGVIGACEDGYTKLIRNGVAPQIARSVFPNALASRIVITGNLRNWRHFLLMRTTKEAHPQMRQVTIPLLAEFRNVIPLLYDDIEPEARQADNLKKGR